MISLSGEWKVYLNGPAGDGAGTGKMIDLPGTVGGAGLGEKISRDTEWFSGLYNPFWYEREEYKSGTGEDFKVPFLSQPKTYYAGKAVYERDFVTDGAGAGDNDGAGADCDNGPETDRNEGLKEGSKFESSKELSNDCIGVESATDATICRSLRSRQEVNNGPETDHSEGLEEGSNNGPEECGDSCNIAAMESNIKREWYLFIELTKWRVSVEIDGKFIGEDESLCAPFLFGPVMLAAGTHHIKVTVDNSMLYPYRPDAHSVSDCLEAGWNGMAGRIGLIGAAEKDRLISDRKTYAAKHPVSVEVVGRNIVVNQKDEYMRGTHFGGGFHETVYPPYERPYWDRLMNTVKEWGFNFIRFHSFCPPEAAFAAADEAGVFLQVECGMWNVFDPEECGACKESDPGDLPADGKPDKSAMNDGDYAGCGMFGVLMRETRKILEWFGHHPSFIMLSPTNEPGGQWYGPLKKWVVLAKQINKELGYEGRRLFTAQSGWFYDVPPAEITGTDYIYFHRSAYGPIHGGMIRNRWGWRGKDYTPSLEGCRLPVLAHEMGQWCAYPDFDVIDKFTGGIRGGNYEIFRDNAAENGVLKYNKEFVYASGRAQLRLLKEDFEANFRTREITGFEYLDLHDYPGQGTAQVGILDAFLDNKGYTTPIEFKTFNSPLVILSRIDGYVYKNTDKLKASFEICNFSGADICDARLELNICAYDDENERKQLINAAYAAGCGGASRPGDRKQVFSGIFEIADTLAGQNTFAGSFEADLSLICKSTGTLLTASFIDKDNNCRSVNYWDLTVFAEEKCGTDPGDAGKSEDKVYYVRTPEEAKKLLDSGKTVVFSPYLSDMDFECPPPGIRNIFWNAQMGPSWSRPLGIVVDTDNPVFKHFPTGKAGGWEWEDILEHARGLNFNPDHANIVRVVDDWNRNFPLSLIFEGRVGCGKLLFCSADLEGGYAERPAAATLKNALIRYAGSEEFDPEQEIKWDDVCRHLKPLYRGMDIIESVELTGGNDKTGCPNRAGNEKDKTGSGDETDPKNRDLSKELEKLTDINPNIPFRYEPEEFPVSFRIKLNKPVDIERLYVLPIQNDRDFPGVIRKYGIKVNGREFGGEWKNGFETQYSDLICEHADELEFTVYSTYSMGTATRWYEEKTGYYRRTATEPLLITAASLGIEYKGADGFRRNDDLFWKGEVVRLNVTIEQ